MWTYSKAEWVGNSLPGLSWHIVLNIVKQERIHHTIDMRSQRYVFHRTQSHGCCTQFWPWICPGSRNSCPTWPMKHARLHRWTLNNATMNGFHSKQSGDVKTCMVCIVLDTNHHDDYYISIHFLHCLLDFSAFSESMIVSRQFRGLAFCWFSEDITRVRFLWQSAPAAPSRALQGSSDFGSLLSSSSSWTLLRDKHRVLKPEIDVPIDPKHRLRKREAGGMALEYTFKLSTRRIPKVMGQNAISH